MRDPSMSGYIKAIPTYIWVSGAIFLAYAVISSVVQVIL